MDILDTIVTQKRTEVAFQRSMFDPVLLKEMAEEETRPVISMKQSLSQSPYGIIAEFKRKSPSKGWIKEEGRAEEIPASYAANGASALSILTDEPFFGGSLKFLKIARPLVDLPILRKDFIIDEYQLHQARVVGADAVLLIAACLTVDECRHLATRAHELSLEVLLEIHSEGELAYLNDCVDMVGVNNRHLGTFHTDVATSFDLAAKLPKQYVRVSESGISNPETVKQLREVGYRGFLIGETFMKTPQPGETLHRFIEQLS
jgi:indole-3-glycerol phosphate synthase